MAFCSFDDGTAMFDATPIENLFLMEYMYDTPEQALKVYLYARMLALHPELGGSTADMAKALRLTEDEVLQAFAYWERRDLVCRRSDAPPTYVLKPLKAQSAGMPNALAQEIYANRDFNNQLQKLFDNVLIGQHELNKAADWVNIMHFDKDAVVRLVEYGIETSRVKKPKPPSVFKRVDRLADEWSRQGIRTLEAVERAIAEESGALSLAREVLKKLGISRQPSDPELEAVRRWTDEWGYDREQVLAACDDTLSARNPTVKYLDSILEKRRGESPERYRELVDILKELNPRSAQPTPDQISRYQALVAAGFAPELIRLGAIQCHRANKERFEDLEWRLNVWRKEGVDTPEEADAYMRRMAALSRQLREVFRKAGSEKRPTYGELETYRRWQEQYPDDLIEFAAECSRNAGGSMAYMDKLLAQWAKDGATTVEAARAQHAAWHAGAGAAARAGAAPANPALDYAQREYKDEDFGDDFFVDLTQYAEEDKQ